MAAYPEKKMEQGYEGVMLTTAHSSKGLEWDYVFNSISKYDSERLHKNSALANARKEEMRRLMFVSMTRAKEELFVSGQYIRYGNIKEKEENDCLMANGAKFCGFSAVLAADLQQVQTGLEQ